MTTEAKRVKWGVYRCPVTKQVCEKLNMDQQDRASAAGKACMAQHPGHAKAMAEKRWRG